MENILIQAAFIIFTIVFAHFQIPIIKAFRDYVPINNPYNKAFHKRSVPVVGIVGLLLIVIYVLSSQIANPVVIVVRAALFIPLFVAWYKIVFDGYIGAAVYKDFFYLGDSSSQDRWIKETFQFTGPGEAKCIICLIVILAVNVFGF